MASYHSTPSANPLGALIDVSKTPTRRDIAALFADGVDVASLAAFRAARGKPVSATHNTHEG